MDRGADFLMVDTEPALEQRLRAAGADQRDAHRGGDDPAHTQAASENSMSLTKWALKILGNPSLMVQDFKDLVRRGF